MLFCMKYSHLHIFAWCFQKALILSMSNKIKQISVIYCHCIAAQPGDGGGVGGQRLGEQRGSFEEAVTTSGSVFSGTNGHNNV